MILIIFHDFSFPRGFEGEFASIFITFGHENRYFHALIGQTPWALGTNSGAKKWDSLLENRHFFIVFYQNSGDLRGIIFIKNVDF